MDTLYAFVFRGVLTEESLDKAGRLKRAKSNMDPELFARLPFELIDNEVLAKSEQMSVVYCLLTGYENTVRDFVVKKLQETYEDEWWNKGVGEKIRKKAENRKTEEESAKWSSQRGDSLINYIDFGDIESIIIKNWKQFEPHLHVIEWMQQLLKSLEKSRNVIMHGGELNRQDIERIGLLIKDWFSQVS